METTEYSGDLLNVSDTPSPEAITIGPLFESQEDVIHEIKYQYGIDQVEMLVLSWQESEY